VTDPVVRLGLTSNQGFVPQRYRILQGQAIHVQYASNTGAQVRAWARVYYDNGVDSTLYVPDQTLTGGRTTAVLTPSEVAVADGWIVDAVVECISANVQRGEAYVKLIAALPTLIFGTVLCCDYVYSTFGTVSLGTYIQPGPGGGGGFLHWAAIKSEGAPAAFLFTFAVSNLIRLVQEVVWYYVSSSTVASRTLQLRLRSPGGGVPTGFQADEIREVWTGSDITLTADQDGIVFMDTRRTGSTDNGAVSIQDGATNPTPLPKLIAEEDTLILSGNLANPEATDVDVCWGLFEDWVILQ